MIMIERHKRVEPFDIALFPLLPVNPPKINAIFFIRLVQHIKIGIPEFRVFAGKRNILFGFGVNPHGFSHFGVSIFKKANPVRRVEV